MGDGRAGANGEEDGGTTGEEGLGDWHADRVRHLADRWLMRIEVPRKSARPLMTVW
jgi:hypothetical protein